MQNGRRTEALSRTLRQMNHAILLTAILGAAPAWAKDFCCNCGNGEKISIDERNSMMASMKCSLVCRDATMAESGQCKVAAVEPAPVEKASAAGEVLLFTTADCSGTATAATASSNDVSSLAANGLYSFQAVSGGPASVWSDVRYSGARTDPVAPSLCISPGWQIKSLKIGTD
jgi:hypothetical protein